MSMLLTVAVYGFAAFGLASTIARMGALVRCFLHKRKSNADAKSKIYLLKIRERSAIQNLLSDVNEVILLSPPRDDTQWSIAVKNARYHMNEYREIRVEVLTLEESLE